jgi:asparagine synthase (glutamine-hydrolysing)
LPAHIPLLGYAFRQSLRAFQHLRGEGNPKVASILEFGGSVPGAYLLRRGLFMPWELANIMGEDLAREGLRRLCPLEHIGEALTPDPRHSFARVSTLESSIYMRNQLLRDTDWASMAHSVEVRVPFVDVELLRNTSRVFTQFPASKVNTKDLIARSPRTNLPEEIAVRRKTGFLTPMSAWLENTKSGEAASKINRTARSHWSRRWALEVASAAQ